MLLLLVFLMTFAMTREEAEKAAIETLSRERGFEIPEIRVRRASPVDWPDESLGCPEPGRQYAPAPTKGYRVTLQARGEIFVVHVAPGRAVVCAPEFSALGGARAGEPIEPPPDDSPAIPLPESPPLRELVLAARSDLAERLGVEPESIDLLEVKAVVWPDASLGCPKPGRAYPQVTREGYVARLRSGKRVYRYHSGAGGKPFLCETKQEPF